MGSFSEGEVVAGRFEIVRPLGAGGLAEVYAARDRVTREEVAVKILHAHLAHDEKLAQRFLREMGVARSLDHPGIVRIFDLYRHEDAQGRIRPLLSMELLRGLTLADRLAEGRLQREEAIVIARGIAQALAAAHKRGVVHRDLKPQNVMLCEGAPGAGVKLLDFGLARAAGWARLSAQSTLLGTPSYMAPELFAGAGADARADLYALGATLFEMLAGRPAFEGADPFAIVQRKAQPAPSPRAVAPHVSEADDKLIRRALHPDPERRFLDAGQVLRALDGDVLPEPPPPAPALVAGVLDVTLHEAMLAPRSKVRALLDALGARSVPRGFWVRLRATGRATLVSGVDRPTAEALAGLCQEQGLAAALEPTKKNKRAASPGAAIGVGAVSGSATAALASAAAATGFLAHGTGAASALVLTSSLGVAASGAVGIYAGVAAGLLAWAASGGGSAPALRSPPGGDPAVWRLREGLARRVLRLRALALPNPLGADLVVAADRLLSDADELARDAAAVQDPLASVDPEGITLRPGELELRDAAMTRLLEVAGTLDEALAVLDAARAPESAASVLARLDDETKFTRRALAEVRAARDAMPPE